MLTVDARQGFAASKAKLIKAKLMLAANQSTIS